MGKKKKFIDKKKSVTFNLVHRSQSDPYCNDPGASQMVLTEQATPSVLSHEERLTEQEKYGIGFQDEYDYLQHLKDPASTIQASLDHQKILSFLPNEVFGKEVKVEGGRLNKVAPLRGPQVDWDPDIVAALDNDGENESQDELLEDDFILQANGGEPGIPVYVNDKSSIRESTDDGIPWWKSRGDFDGAMEGEYSSSSEEEEEEEEGGGRFTSYSMTSADVPRNEGLSMLDERFEEFMVEYNDDQIGPLEETEECKEVGEIENMLLETAMDEFDIKHKSLRKKLEKAQNSERVEIEYSESESEEELLMEAGGGREGERWDCESILSTYSNLYNHPTLIEVPSSEQTKTRKESMSTDCDSNEATIKLRAITIRPKNESAEEKKARKRGVKNERRERRSIKKSNRDTFKREELKLTKQLINNPPKTSLI
ncbi:PREDICTED: protein LTV1 homolog [Amphimedon queenslandica]|uniref:Protein LTV1 homolog n=1 Tax=Amphimedon queenslandica TaxID=400682 RepID=A0A1X7V1T2_AMPQE|nr:PREDICTED: protein LTV1 homolog [Amphimedon queenslandica]|eukprot:XP_019851057.1 PREDICTED: protein LTV1 homolog [Amphimedon queenslandica]